MRLTIITLSILTMLSLPILAAPAGYESEALTTTQAVGSVFIVDSDNMLYYGHSSSKREPVFESGRLSRGPSNQIYAHDLDSGTDGLFYDADNHPGANQIKSASAMAVDETTTPWTYYIADQDPADDPWTHGAVWIAQDINDDGDIDDSGETVLMTADDAFIYIEGLILDTDSGVLYVTEGTGTTGSTMVFRLADVSANGFFEPGEITDYFLEPGGFFAGKLAFDGANTDVIYTVDSGGNVYRLEDLNADHDCLDSGESEVVAGALVSGFGIAVDPEGDVFVTGSDYMTGEHYLYEITPGTPATVAVFEDLAAFAGWTGPITFDHGSGFEPGGAGATLYMGYTDLMFSDPSNIVTYRGQPIQTPATGLSGILALIAAVSLLMLPDLKKKLFNRWM